MKNIMFRFALGLVALVSLSGTAFADAGGFNVPDGGSSALLLALSLAGVALGRKLLRK